MADDAKDDAKSVHKRAGIFQLDEQQRHFDFTNVYKGVRKGFRRFTKVYDFIRYRCNEIVDITDK